MLLISEIETDLGVMIAGAVNEGLCLLEFNDRKMLKNEYSDLQRLLMTSIEKGENEHIINTAKQLKEYFEGSRKDFSIPLVTPGTDFQQSVWKELINVKYGKTRTYLEQSIAMGIPGSVRAVANANGMNRIAIIIPCHRIIGSDGSLTGYAGGLKRKKWLLDHEKKYSGQPVSISLFSDNNEFKN